MFELPQQGMVDGSDDVHPLLLPDVSVVEFRAFIRAALAQ
jgi:hypothetical protein